MTSDQKRGFRIGTWNGVDNYECLFCPFAAAGKRGVARIRPHVADHMRRGDAPRTTNPLAGLNMTERAGEVAVALMEAGRLDVDRLLSREPSGRTGYTVADVEAAALTTKEG